MSTTKHDEIIDFDDFLANGQQEDFDNLTLQETQPKKTKKKEFIDDKLRLSREKMLEKINLGTSTDALSRNARVKLELHMKQTPQYKVILQQMEILTEEFEKYKASGEKELANKTKDLINELSLKGKKFVKLYRKDSLKTIQKESKENINNSEEIKNLKLRQKEIKEELKLTSPSHLVFRIKQYREFLNIKKDDLKNVDIFDDIEDLDDVLSTSVTEQDYNNLCAYISEILDILPSEVASMNNSEIYRLLKENENVDKLASLNKDLESINIQMSTEIAKAKGYEDITNFIFDIFDFQTTPEEKPKEMLAASNVEYVKTLAYYQCFKLNMLHYLDDAVAYGLLGLTKAINRWYGMQKMTDSALSFTGFAYIDVSFAIQKGLHELSSGGTINKSSAATLHHKRNTRIKNFLLENPELKGLPANMIEPLIEGLEVKPNVVTESEYKDIVGGQDSDDSADIWANSAISTMDTESMNQVQIEFEELVKSIKGLFGLFKTKIKDGEKVTTEQKMFNRFDFKLFKLIFGIEYKEEYDEKGNKKIRFYRQDEIAEILTAYYEKLGATRRFTQPAISARIETLKKSLKNAIDLYPGLKPGFEYIWNYMQGKFDNLGDVDKSLAGMSLTSEEFTIPEQIVLEDSMEEEMEYNFEEEDNF